MPLADYPWAEMLHDLDLPTFAGCRYIEVSEDEYDGGDIRWMQFSDEPGEYGFVAVSNDDPEIMWDEQVPDYMILDLEHAPTYAVMCEVLADLMGHEGSVAEISRDNAFSNCPQFWTAAIPRGPVGVTVLHLHRSDGLQTKEEALAFALRSYLTGRSDDDVVEASYEDAPNVDRMALLMEEE